MNAVEYIKLSLEGLSKEINGINIKYAYDTVSNFHIIEISPESIRRGNEDYMKWEGNMWKEFYELYPNEDILISEPDDTNNMKNILFEISSEQKTESCNCAMSFNFDMDNGLTNSVSNNENSNLLVAA